MILTGSSVPWTGGVSERLAAREFTPSFLGDSLLHNSSHKVRCGGVSVPTLVQAPLEEPGTATLRKRP